MTPYESSAGFASTNTPLKPDKARKNMDETSQYTRMGILKRNRRLAYMYKILEDTLKAVEFSDEASNIARKALGSFQET